MLQKIDRNEAFVRIFAANQRRIHAFISVLVPRAADADDIFQDVSLELWRKFDAFTIGTDFVAWANQFSRFLVLKHFARQRRLGRLVFDDRVLELLTKEAASATTQADDRLDALRHCLGHLPAKSKSLLSMRYESGLKTCREVAARMGRSTDAVYKALSRLHVALLECIEGRLAADRREAR
jgi:RNA polymerase sigma-70 factor (ECF subfamily)